MTDQDHSEDVDDPLHTDNGDGPSTANVDPTEEDPGWPWSFILLVVAGALYLIFRFIELFINIFT